jgi:hypothetical protein
MGKKLIFVTLGLIVATVAVTASVAVGGDPPNQLQAGAGTADPTCDHVVLASGVDGGTTICVSRHGNVVSYNSPTGFEHIGVGTVSEGYVLCYTDPSGGHQNAHDLGEASEAGFGPSAVTSLAPLTIVRTTSDGALELRQRFLPNAARHELIVQNRIRNVGSMPVTNVVFSRSVDFDIDGDFGGDNHAADDRDAYFAWHDWDDSAAEAHMMSLAQHPGSGAPRQAKIITSFDDLFACGPAPVTSPQLNLDAAGRLQYNIGTLNPGISRQPTVIYNRH